MALGDFAQPGGGSEAGDFVRLANGAMVPRNHPLAIAELGPQTGVQANTMARQPEPVAIAPAAAPVLTAQPGLPAMGTPEGPYGNPKNLGSGGLEAPEAVPGFGGGDKLGWGGNPDAMLNMQRVAAQGGYQPYEQGGVTGGLSGRLQGSGDGWGAADPAGGTAMGAQGWGGTQTLGGIDGGSGLKFQAPPLGGTLADIMRQRAQPRSIGGPLGALGNVMGGATRGVNAVGKGIGSALGAFKMWGR